MKEKLFTGTATALVTPFQGDGIDLSALETLINRQLEAGIRCIIVGGTTGEGATLTPSEKAALITISKDLAGNDCMIIAGTGSNDTRQAVAQSIAARELGADALLIVSPYYNKANAGGLIAHYHRIAEAVDLPIILYNVPSRTGVDMPVSVYKELSAISNIAGVKEASSDIRKIQDIRAQCPKDFAIWCGNDDMVCAAMAVGADGVISVASNILPQTMLELTEAALAGNFCRASEIQLNLLPLIECLFCDVNPLPVKAALNMIGLPCGNCRLPLTEPDREKREQIQNCLEEYKSYNSSVFN